MRNVEFESCGCNSFDIIGVIRNGRRYDNGNVTVEAFNQEVSALNDKLNNIGEVAVLANSKADNLKTNTNQIIDDMNNMAIKHDADVEKISTATSELGDDLEKTNLDVKELSDESEDLKEKITALGTNFNEIFELVDD